MEKYIVYKHNDSETYFICTIFGNLYYSSENFIKDGLIKFKISCKEDIFKNSIKFVKNFMENESFVKYYIKINEYSSFEELYKSFISNLIFL